MDKKTTVVFNGEIYVRSANSKYYFKYTTKNKDRKGAKQLHRAVWEFYNGEIPKGYQIHHKDKDIDNNDISNLECISTKEHLSKHSKENLKNDLVRQKFVKAGQEAAKLWHGSEEGKKWHTSHAKNSVLKTFEKKNKKICEYCGNEYYGYTSLTKQKYCSNKCQSKAWFIENKKLKLEVIKCDYCNKEFTPTKTINRFCCGKCKSLWGYYNKYRRVKTDE